MEGIVDTGCIAAHGSAVAVIDRAGNLYVSEDAGRAWSRRVDGLPPPSSILIVEPCATSMKSGATVMVRDTAN
jgi:hypothetical protein